MTSQQHLVCDNSTVANFKQWAQAISNAFATFGWVQSSDTGQVNWSTISAPPGINTYVFEIWKPNDGLTPFFVKVSYGNTNVANNPNIGLQIGTGTDGAGNLTGFVTGPLLCGNVNYTMPASSATAQFECNFSGASGRMAVMMWRNADPGYAQASGNGTATSAQMIFAIERSLNASGSYIGAYVTMVLGGASPGNPWPTFRQQSLVFGVGATLTPVYANRGNPQLSIRLPLLSNTTIGPNSSTFNGSLMFDMVTPQVGFLDYPMTMIGAGGFLDFADGVTFGASLYGTNHTFIPAKGGPFTFCNAQVGDQTGCIIMRYD